MFQRYGRWLLLVGGALSCGVPEQGEDAWGTAEQPFSSREATQLDFEFDGELVLAGRSTASARYAVDSQVRYTVGELNGENSVGRLDKLELLDLTTTYDEALDVTQVRYRVKLPVAWGSKDDLPSSYTFRLPRRADYSGLTAYAQTYGHCVVPGANHGDPVDAGNMWYYYRPDARGCRLADEDVVRPTATVTVSSENTTGQYPEYDQVWADNTLTVVAIFGKNKAEAGTGRPGAPTYDVGINGYNDFVNSVRTYFGSRGEVVTEPQDVPTRPGVDMPDVTVTATLPDGKVVRVHALLVSAISSAPRSFYDRYEALSTAADLIVYSGHSGLGQNVRALARYGKFDPGKYLVVFMNGCDTFAYVDGYLADTRASLNPDDPTGTKYMDIVTNAMPAYFSQMNRAVMSFVRALAAPQTPKTYEDIFAGVDPEQVVLVTGEEDNTFAPAPAPPPAEAP